MLNVTAKNESNHELPQCLGVTVLGHRFLKDEKILKCIRSWKNILGLSIVKVINDGSLNDEDIDFLEGSLGLQVFGNDELEEKVYARVESLPHIRNYLKEIRHYKKAIYTPLLSHGFHRCLLIDSDVFVAQKVSLPDFEESPDIVICSDDIPAYRLHWSAGFRIPLAPCINSGFVYFRPSSINLDYLESVFEKVRSKSENKWWVEQATWAIYCGYVDRKGLFNGEDARVVSGLGKRTATEIINNQFVWYRKTSPNTEVEIKEMLEGAAVIHFAGPGKRWIDLLNDRSQELSTIETRQLSWYEFQNAKGFEALLLTCRLAAIELAEKYSKSR